MKYGIRVASPGKSVKSTLLSDISYTSEEKFLKAFKQGFAAIDVTGIGSFSVDITHNLGYHPMFLHLASVDPANPTRRFLGRSAASGPGGDIGIDSYVTKEVLRIMWKEPGLTGHAYPFKVTFYYYIFYDALEGI